MVDLETITVDELEAYILTLPDNSPCGRAEIERLKVVLNNKRLNQ